MALISSFNRFYQRAKNIIHAIQALAVFIAAIITIAILTKSGQSDSRITYYFVLCLICIPFLIYQTAFPTFRKTRKLANAYAHLVIDTLLTILWLAAFVGEIVWAKDGTKAAKNFKSGDSTCGVFDYGSTDKCHLGQVTTVFGIVICVLFALTTAFSTYGLIHYRKTGALPGHDINPIDPTTGKGDDLEFTGASPNAYDVLHSQQEMQEQQPQQPPFSGQTNGVRGEENNQSHIESPPLTPNTIQLRESEGHATLPPRPLYSKAPRSPLNNGFQLAPNDFLHSTNLHPEPYTSRPTSYEGYQNESGDYSVPPSPRLRPNVAELPSLRVDTRPGNSWSRAGGRMGGEVSFPAGNYER